MALDALLKALLYIGTVLALGAGVFAWFVGPRSLVGNARRRLRFGLLTGAVVLLVASPLHVAVTVSSLLGYFDPSLAFEYLLDTRHGSATLVRLLAVGLLVVFTLAPLGRTSGRLLFGVTGLLLLGSFSWASHAVSVGGNLPLLADLLHLAAGTVWAGAVLYTAWLPLSTVGFMDEQHLVAVDRVSSIGILSVGLVAITGVYTALLHVRSPEILTGSPYGQALSIKNALVLVIVALAAVNRWWFLPRLHAGRSPIGFIRLFRIEALLLLAVMAATGLLTTSALPHEPGVSPNPLESLRNFLPWIGK